MHAESVKDDRAPVQRAVSPAAPAQPAFSSGAVGLVGLQRSAGNRAVSGLVLHLQRCGGTSHPGCECAGEASTGLDELMPDLAPRHAVQRDPEVQRDGEKDPADLTGTPFESLDAGLQKVLKDKAKFPWSKPTLAETLGDMSNATIAVLARVGAMISSQASFLWDQVAKLGPGSWITDNFGISVQWTSPGGLAGALAAHADFCKDNPVTALYFHGTTSAYRRIPYPPGAASLHVITAGKTEVHVDSHQPVKGKDSFPFEGQCMWDYESWKEHAADVDAGGARATPIGRYAVARNQVKTARADMSYRKDEDEPKIAQADQHLETIMLAVQKYAALGKMVGKEWEGDLQMQKDAATMGHLTQAEELLKQVDSSQSDRRPPDAGGAGF